MELERGDIIQDNDPRMPNRKLRILHFVQTDAGVRKALCETLGIYPRGFAIKLDRIFTDGKPRRYGFSRVDVSSMPPAKEGT